jgi:hypothetical protein
MTFPPLGGLHCFLTGPAPDGERQRAEPLVGNFGPTLVTRAVLTFLEAGQGVSDLDGELCANLNEGELEIFVRFHFGEVSCTASRSRDGRYSFRVPHSVAHVVQYGAMLVFEHGL